MSKYKTLIFDLDDTLIDNTESSKYAFKIILDYLGIPYTEELFINWINFDTAYWLKWETGKMNIPDTIKTLEKKRTYLRSNRFILFFKELNLSFKDAIKLNEIYCAMLGENIVEIENAKELLQDIHSYYEIIIATNGPRNAALRKIEKAKLDSYISFVLSSEEVGFSKPMPEFFYELFKRIENKDKSRMLLIGDSLATDIDGGINNGIDTCWFNPNNNPLPHEHKPTMTINKLLDLKKQLKR